VGRAAAGQGHRAHEPLLAVPGGARPHCWSHGDERRDVQRLTAGIARYPFSHYSLLERVNSLLERVNCRASGFVNRVVVLGRGGAGKSAASRELGRRTGLPVIELDSIYWDERLTPLTVADWEERQRPLGRNR